MFLAIICGFCFGKYERHWPNTVTYRPRDPKHESA